MLPQLTLRLRWFKPWAFTSSMANPRRMYCGLPSLLRTTRSTSKSLWMIRMTPEISRSIVTINDSVLGLKSIKRHASTSTNNFGDGTNTENLLSDASPSFLELMEAHSTTTLTGTIFSDTAPVIFTADILCALKDLDGLSWVQVILFTTIFMRLLTGLPTAIAQQRSLKRLEDLKPELLQLAEDLKRETGYAIKKFGWDEKTAKTQFRKSYKKHWRKLMEEHNCHPMKSLCLAVLQIPVWICFSSALRNIVFGLPLPRSEEQAQRWYEMFQEGTPWIDNLTVSDPYVLPAIFLTTNLLNIYLHSRNRSAIPVRSNLQIALPWVFSGGIVFISVLACYVPSAVTLYWATSSSVALTQNILLMHPGLRKKLKLPDYSPSAVPQQKDKISAKL